MVYRYSALHGRVFRYAPREFYPVESISFYLQCTKIVTRVLLNKDSYTGTVNQSPYFAGIIAASMLWVGYGWATRLVRGTPSSLSVDLALSHRVWQKRLSIRSSTWLLHLSLVCVHTTSSEQLPLIRVHVLGQQMTES